MSRLKVGISGFGRIGRILFRKGFEDLDIVAINDLGDVSKAAHLLEFDSTHGRYDKKIEHDESNIYVDGKKIKIFSERDPANIPWSDLGVDIVLECTGAFKKKEDFMKHVSQGAKRVLVSAPCPGADLTIVYGVNHKDYKSSDHQVISNASCTTNCLAPLAKTLNDAFEIENGLMTTIHSYTLDQRILDSTHSDLRRSRAAAVSMIPTTTGAAKAVGMVLPELNGKVDGFAMRVPTPNVSLVDFTIKTKKDLSVEAINETIINASETTLKGILSYENKPLVSTDYNGNEFSSIVDLPLTILSGNKMAKIISWYDNETGFSRRMIDMALYMQKQGI